MFVYPRFVIDDAELLSYWSIVAVAIVVASCIVLWLKSYRGPFIALSFFAGTVFPAIGFFNVYPHRFSFVADHFVYLASAGVLVLLVSGGWWFLRVKPQAARAAFVLIAAFILPALIGLSFLQARTYKDAETVWRDTIDKNPRAWLAQINLASRLLMRADVLIREGKTREADKLVDEARPHAEIGLELAPHIPQAYTTLADVLRLEGHYERALQLQAQGIGIVEDRLSGNPLAPKPLAKDYFALGRLHHLLKQFEKTESAFHRAIEIAPDDAMLHFEMAQFLVRQERPNEALLHYEAVLAANPRDFVSLMMVGRIAKQQGRDAIAAEFFERARQASTDAFAEYSAASELARLLAGSDDAMVRNPDAAIRLMEQYVQITGREVPGLMDVLASLYFSVGRVGDAIAIAEEAAAKARAAGAIELAGEIEARLAQYRAGREQAGSTDTQE
jgi:tetratricopeptide (TPR) repeat protein